MSHTTKSVLLWTLSFVLMAGFAIYQKMTGPTYPIGGKVTINSQKYKYSLPRSHGGDDDEMIKLEIPDKTVTGTITFKRFKSYDEWQTKPLIRQNNFLTADLPHQPAAGKVIYKIALKGNDAKTVELTNEPVIIRFKGDVPLLVLIPHIIFIFCAMWFSTRTGFEAITGGKNSYKLALLTTITFAVAGLFFGPIVQKYAFGVYWSGWPFGHDLTDNKAFVAIIMWIIAVWRTRKNPESKGWIIAASIVLIAVFLIPHSVLGSEIDYTKTVH